MLSLTACPDCGAPAEITGRFTLASTDGPVAHVAITCLSGHHYRMPADRLPRPESPPGPPASRRPVILPRRSWLCVRCQVNPAGFWVSATGSSVVRRPWCLSCCAHLDRAACHVTPFTP